jgi:hypothetical protein
MGGPTVTLTDLLDKLSGVKQVGTGYMALCPSHLDEKASLHVTSNGKGLALKCHAGCDTADVLKELDLEWDDLFFEEQRNGTGPKEIVATYPYRDEKGQLLYEVVRYDPKEFRQRRPDGAGWAWNLRNVRRVPYMLNEIVDSDKEAPIFIVEGEKDVHVLRIHDYIATTNAGGAGKWQEEWTPYFKGRRVYLIPDADEPGMQHMQQVGQYLHEVAEVRVISLPRSKDVTDFLIDNDIEDFHRAIEASVPFGTPVEEQEEEFRFSPPDAPIYDGLIGQIVRLIEPHSEADPIAIFVELMVAFGNCLGKGPHHVVQGATEHHANLFIVLCGLTSKGRKGSAHDWMKKIFRCVDDKGQYVDQCFWGGLASGEGLIHAVRDPKTKTNKKGEVEVIDDGVTDKRKLFFEPELAGRTFTAMHREGSTLSAILREAWDGGNLVVATKQSDDRATSPHISIVGHATFKELSTALSPADISGGTANRFLFFAVQRSKRLAFSTEPDPLELGRLVGRMAHNLAEGRKLHRVELAEEAKQLWKEMYEGTDEIESDDPTIAEYIGRGAPQILRMALILSIADGQPKITAEALKQAAGLFNYVRASVEFMLGVGDVFTSKAEERLYNLVDKEGPISVSDISKKLKMNGGRVRQIAGGLVRRRMLSEQLDRRTGGRPSKKYYT